MFPGKHPPRVCWKSSRFRKELRQGHRKLAEVSRSGSSADTEDRLTEDSPPASSGATSGFVAAGSGGLAPSQVGEDRVARNAWWMIYAIGVLGLL